MVDAPDHATLEILKRIQNDLSTVNRRVASIETVVRKIRRDNAGMLVMMRATAGDFEDRVSELEATVKRLERPQA